MDFSVIFQLRNKKFWWMDVIFYFAIALLLASVFSYLIFLLKNNFQRQDIVKETAALQTVGTTQQKEYEEEVVDYRTKIADFVVLFKDHEFASNVLAFMQTQTMPNIWFKQFNLDERNNAVQLVGESDNMDAFSRQVATFEKNKYVKSVGSLSSSLGDSVRVQFSINLALDQSIFSYLSDMASAIKTPVEPEQPITELEEALQNSEKLITAFRILLDPEVIGVVDQTNFVIKADVPFGTDVKNLTASIVISPTATVLPDPSTITDFTNPVNYTVVAQDGSTQNYQVVINVLPEVVKETKKSGLNIFASILIIVVVILAIGGIIFFAWKKFKKQKINQTL